MQLNVFCKSCKKLSKIKSKAKSRPDLVDDIGEYFNHKCKSCGGAHEYHVNQVKASASYNLLGFLAGLFVIGFITIFFWNRGWITNVGLLIGCSVMAATNVSSFTSNTNAFNKYYVTVTKKE